MFETIAQVEDFWSLYNHVSLASKLPPGSDYSFFKVSVQLFCAEASLKWNLAHVLQPDLTLYDATSVTKLNQEGIFPDWEDEKNGSGGRWIINSDRWIPGRDADLSWIDVALHRQQRVDVLDTHWLEILIFMIGEQAEVVHLQLKMSLLSNWGLTNDLLYRCTHLRSTELLWICAPRGTNWGWVKWLFKMGQILDWLIENGSQDSSNTGLNLFINFSFINNDYLKVWLADTSADSVLRVGRQLFCWEKDIVN